MLNEKRRAAAEAASFSRMAYTILGKEIKIKFLEKGDSRLGFTDGESRTIFLAWEHELFAEMSDEKKSIFRMGIFAHELLHHVYTNFSYTEKIMAGKEKSWQAIFMKYANTLEDPAIEYFASQVMGGNLLKALKFQIMEIYKKSPGIEKSRTAFSQFLNALIHFGDMGIVKGKFTFPEAYKYFKIVAPIYNQGITCPDNKKRLEYALECMEKSKPLWEEEKNLSDMMEELMRELTEHLLKKGIDSEEKSAEEEETNSEEVKEEKTEVEKRRKSILKFISEPIEGEETTSADSEEPLESEETTSTDSKKTTDFEKEIRDFEKEMKKHEEHLKDDEEFSISDEDIEKIEKSLEMESTRIEKESGKESSKKGKDVDLMDIDIHTNIGKNATCKNISMQKEVVGREESIKRLYGSLVKNNKGTIQGLTKTLKRIFDSDVEEYVRNDSGKYNVLRGTVATTTKIFDKKKEKSDYKNVEVVLLIDESGSMKINGRMEQARNTAIIVSEALSNLDIKHYVVGFTADDMGVNAVHKHYVEWNSKNNSLLALMSASRNNFDGYSIRYASHLFDGRNVKNKILFVLSDGEPLCLSYKGRKTGIEDTISAIREARKKCKVFGIAFGNGCNPAVMQHMYGSDFIYCEDERMLSKTLSKKLKKLIVTD